MYLASAFIALLFVSGSVLIVWSVYFSGIRFVRAGFGSDTETLAGSVIIRVSALHGLILALVFAQELVSYEELQRNLVREATAVADIYNDIDRYGAEEKSAIQSSLSSYVRLVVDKEWRILAEGNELSAEGWALREKIYQAVLDLVPNNPRQEALRDHMINKVQLIAEFRQERENNANRTVNPLFWIAAIVGIVLITIPYFVFSPTRLHIVLLSVYGAFSGLVMFVIYAFSDPFSDPGALEPIPFERLLKTEIGESR